MFVYIMKKCPIPLSTMESMLTRSSEEAAEFYVRYMLDSKNVCRLPFGIRNERLQKALNYIREHCREEISLHSVSSLIAITVDGFEKLIMRNCKKSFKTIQIEYRITAAMELIAGTDELIGSIAYDCGYSCTKSFHKHFRECVGMTPGEYRKKFDRYNRYLQEKETMAKGEFYLLPAFNAESESSQRLVRIPG
jgi:transcriptional regulator GlxA family with amidase domain